MKKIITILLSIIVIVIIGFSIISFLPGLGGTSSVDSRQINAVLSEASELTTAKLSYTGMSEYKDTGFPFINKSDFIMVYDAEARAGIDFKDIKVDVDDENQIVSLVIPKAKVLDVKVDSSSIKYFDEKFAL